ncbi:acylpyruvate hydrolase [Barrientosiimonas humi]|uniref:Acylpyruvate hydrolase n=1 Tax=Barrientosiimonas humi TaxID=999931 RepID=A0A542XAP5_9MICO|nr:fumarylacetoacetate hydrolase family protein [Barrientosiimonas humi]TQL32897.1 acylpyruvate hydrolase [Barrientosiimonas humi]CAG7572887.1 Ureidoglycolate lyase [Barrientosiimonas humi]
MKLATIRRPDERTRAVRIDGDTVLDLGVSDLGALLAEPGWRERAAGGDPLAVRPEQLSFAPVVPRPGKIVCVGLNYRQHITEMGREIPQFPTLFAKYPEALIGADDPLVLPAESDAVDWEAELAVVVGARVRHADEAAAAEAIAGFSVLNDVTTRDWQYRSPQWLQGKTFEATTPFGPFLVTPDELEGGVRPRLELLGQVDGETVQKADTADLVFDPVALVAYVSRILTLQPGDVIATGTPGGVGHARTPARYLADGDVLTTEISGLGRSRVEVRGRA